MCTIEIILTHLYMCSINVKGYSLQQKLCRIVRISLLAKCSL